MAQLHELLAVEADKNNIASKLVDESKATLSKKPDHFRGFTKTLSYFDPARAAENAEETKLVVSTVSENLDYTAYHIADYFDVVLQKELTNQTANADLVLDGTIFGKGLPATFLLGMETRLKGLRPALEAIPTLPPAINWQPDTNSGVGHYRSPQTMVPKTEKRVKFVTLAPATDKHPAQVKDWIEDEAVAKVETVEFSGMWTVEQKADAIDRLDRLLQAVKKARQRANMAEVVPGSIGDKLTSYILNGTKPA
jgi:hypothetical protein